MNVILFNRRSDDLMLSKLFDKIFNNEFFYEFTMINKDIA